MRKIATVAGFLTLVLCSIVSANGRALILQPSIPLNTSSANMAIRVTVAKHPDNRKLWLYCDSGEHYRYGEANLDGNTAPLITPFEFFLPADIYDCVATLISISKEGKRRESVASIRMIVH